MERQELTNPNIIRVFIQTEKGCDPLEGEYSLSIGNSKYPLDISSPGGVDDVSLVKDAIHANQHLPDSHLAATEVWAGLTT